MLKEAKLDLIAITSSMNYIPQEKIKELQYQLQHLEVILSFGSDPNL